MTDLNPQRMNAGNDPTCTVDNYFGMVEGYVHARGIPDVREGPLCE